MTRALKLLGLCLAFGLVTVGVSPSASQAQAQALHSVADSLKDGTIKVSQVDHPTSGVNWGRAVGVVDAPIDQVMAVVQDYASYQTFMPHFKTSKVLSHRGTSALVYMEASIAKDTVKLWAQLKIAPTASVQPDTQVIAAKMQSGNMNAMEAVWEVTQIDATHTLVAFQLLMDPKLPLPDSFISSENEKASGRTIKALRQVITARAKPTAQPATTSL